MGLEVDWLYGLQHFGVKLGLGNIRRLLDILDRPQAAYPSISIAGTNGKGSVAVMLHSMLGASGLRAGLFTSPHLVRPNERIRIGDDDIDDAGLERQLRRMRETIAAALERGALETHPSFFEVITATALQSFRERGVQAAVLEVGLGGRLDATNAVDAGLSVIVSIDYDHTKTLGPTLENIAREKAGIVKPNAPLVSGAEAPSVIRVLQAICRERGAPLVDARDAVRLVAEDGPIVALESDRQRYDGLRLGLPGRHQIHNARVALAAFEQFAERAGFEPDPNAVRAALASVRWPGRLQWVRGSRGQGDLLLDGAHNAAGARALAEFLRGLPGPEPVVLFGAMHGKQVTEMIEPLAPLVREVVITRPSVERAMDPDEVAAILCGHVDHIETVPDPSRALDRARQLAGPERYVLVTGSLYLVGEVLGRLEAQQVPGPVSM